MTKKNKLFKFRKKKKYNKKLILLNNLNKIKQIKLKIKINKNNRLTKKNKLLKFSKKVKIILIKYSKLNKKKKYNKKIILLNNPNKIMQIKLKIKINKNNRNRQTKINKLLKFSK